MLKRLTAAAGAVGAATGAGLAVVDDEVEGVREVVVEVVIGIEEAIAEA
jgi:hypothetical protein